MIYLKVGGTLEIIGLKEYPELFILTQKYLTICNPLFNKRIQMGLQNWGIPQNLLYYTISGNSVFTPIGYAPVLLSELVTRKIQYKIKDNRVVHELKNPILFTGVLRDYQQDIINACTTHSLGVVDSMTGSGKTICFVYLTFHRKQNTLVLVNTLELADQTINSYLEFTNLKKQDIGLIGAGKYDIKPVTIGLHQTLTRLSEDKFQELNNNFGMIISDETHIVPASTFYTNLSKLKAKYKYGFSATPKREDGLTAVINFANGPIIHSVPADKLSQVLIKPDVKPVKTSYYFSLFSTQEYQQMISDLSEDIERNKLIVDTLQKNYKNNYVCLLCQRISQIKILKEMLGDEAVILISNMSKKERKEVMESLRNKNKKYIISSYGLFSQGINLPHLEVLFLCAPIKSEIKVRQALGRLMRICEGKTKAIVIDFVDSRIELLDHHFKQRTKIYKTL